MSTAAPHGELLQRDTSRLSLETIKEDMEDKELSIIENQAESTKTSPKVAEANDGSEFMMITVGHCRNVVPAPKYHAELGMTSRPTKSQKQYEECMMAKHVQANSNGSVLPSQAEDDEIITIVCKHDTLPFLTPLTIKRSALQRSPRLAGFFQSSHYLVGSGTQLEFHGNGVACMRVIKEYLEDGPDIYTVDKLREYATHETAAYKAYNFLLMVCVHKVAAQLGVYSLTNLAYAVLYQLECSVTAGDCIKLIGLVFNTNHHFDNAIQNWLLEQVDRHFDSLSVSRDWANAIVKSSADFKVVWANITLAHLSPLSTTITTREEAKAPVPTAAKPLPANTFAEYNSEGTALDDYSSDDYYEPQDYARGRSDRENAKARRVLGINDDGGGLIAGRVDKKKPSGLARASRSLMGLMKRE